MKINILKGLCISLLLCGLTTSCSSDYLDTKPTSEISGDDIATSIEKIRSVLEGVHGMMYQYEWYSRDPLFGSGQASMQMHLDFLGDDMINTKAGFHISQHRYQDTNTPYTTFNFEVWDFYYTLIQHLNAVINDAEALNDPDNSDVASVLGEAYSLRAFCYHNLVQCFGKRYVKGGDNSSLGVPLRLKQDYEVVPRSTVEKCYEQINSDITKGIDNLTKAPDLGRKNAVSLATAYGLAARIALTQQDYPKAEEYAKDAIEKAKEDGIHLATGDFSTGGDLLDGFNTINNSEWMWGYTQASDQNLFYADFNSCFAYNTSGYNYGFRFAVRRDLYDAMGPKDIRRRWWVCGDLMVDQSPLAVDVPADADPTYFASDWEKTGQCIKFASNGSSTTMGDHCVMRLDEMYYIEAEAQARQSNKQADAERTLNTIMQTRDPEYLYSAKKGTLIDEIMRNKRIDMWGEGARFFDMKRLGIIPVRKDAKNLEIIRQYWPNEYNAAALRFAEANEVDMPKSVDDVNWQFIIPYDEIKAGQGMIEQNPMR